MLQPRPPPVAVTASLHHHAQAGHHNRRGWRQRQQRPRGAADCIKEKVWQEFESPCQASRSTHCGSEPWQFSERIAVVVIQESEQWKRWEWECGSVVLVVDRVDRHSWYNRRRLAVQIDVKQCHQCSREWQHRCDHRTDHPRNNNSSPTGECSRSGGHHHPRTPAVGSAGCRPRGPRDRKSVV